jgi:hypothetical protein
MRRIAPLRLLQHFPIQASMETFIFPHGLGMVRPTVTDADAHTNQPDGQDGVGLLTGVAPGTPVIGQQPIGQAILPKHREQGRLHRLAGLRKQRLETQIKPRMVIQDSQGLPRGNPGRDGPLEIHLPQVIGGGVFKPLPGMRRGRGCRVEQPFALQ